MGVISKEMGVRGWGRGSREGGLFRLLQMMRAQSWGSCGSAQSTAENIPLSGTPE